MGTQFLKLPRLDRTLTIQLVLGLLWIFTLSWGERRTFANSVEPCRWDAWEKWPPQARPHRIALVADPQLVDPHTYPGRPWPLSDFTIKHTDQYLRRSFTSIQSYLRPRSVLFLGDLFDGGREWSTAKSKSPEQRWQKYGNAFWMQEFERFLKIFVDPWVERVRSEKSHVRHRFIASLPGNHDLGFSEGIQLPVRERFNTFFGESNRVDIIGNHTFVSVDTVSLSARMHMDKEHDAVWRPSEEFLQVSRTKKAQALERELKAMFGRPPKKGLEHAVIETSKMDAKAHSNIVDAATSDMPTILLTHVPLYRDPGTPCGPMRERFPPSRSTSDFDETEKDERNAIKVHGGYQYQNVLDDKITKELVEKIGGIEHVFSGDDHDYCEVVHRGYSSRGGGIREITVKSISWAMGVRKPGFLLLSLWNPIDSRGNSLDHEKSSAQPTMQTHLCLLPDQLGIFIRYLLLFCFTLVLLSLDAFLTSSSPQKKTEHDEPLLPLSTGHTPKHSHYNSPSHSQSYGHSDSSSLSISSITNGGAQLASRITAAIPRTRSSSPTKGYGQSLPTHTPSSSRDHGYGLPSNSIMRRSIEFSHIDPMDPDYAEGAFKSRRRQAYAYSPRLKHMQQKPFLSHLGKSFSVVASVGLCWYAWLAFTL